MHQFETQYLDLVSDILEFGQEVKTRNGITKSLFGKVLDIDMSDNITFPLLESRKIFYKGVLGELAAFLRGPKTIKDFEDQGCNYWKKWGNPDGTINIDYGNSWLNFNGVNQLNDLRTLLKEFPHDRRLLISGWNPGNLADLNLPCCHLLYQWYVRDTDYLDMIWYQRSADTMIGIPSDIVLAAAMNILLANNVGLKPGRIKMIFGDTHIYEEHFGLAKEQLYRYPKLGFEYPTYMLSMPKLANMETFKADYLSIGDYYPLPAINYELKA